MWVCSVVSSALFLMATAAGQEYLPPSKGYNYEPPTIPFNPNSNKQPTLAPVPRPIPTTRPSYIPPSPTPGTGAVQQPGQGYDYGHNHDHSHDHSHDQSHDHGHEDHHHHEPGMPFDFSYQVNEDGNDYSHNAISDGDVTKGEYRVALPDGRTQIVKYTADWKNGFNAEVTYEGEARYPDPPAGGYPAAGNRGNNNGNAAGQAYLPPNQGGGYQY